MTWAQIAFSRLTISACRTEGREKKKHTQSSSPAYTRASSSSHYPHLLRSAQLTSFVPLLLGHQRLLFQSQCVTVFHLNITYFLSFLFFLTLLMRPLVSRQKQCASEIQTFCGSALTVKSEVIWGLLAFQSLLESSDVAYYLLATM